MNATADNLNTHRLLLGIEASDLLRNQALTSPVRMEIETGLPHTSGLPDDSRFSHRQMPGKRPTGLLRSNSGRYTLRFYPDSGDSVVIRIYDLNRVYVPRRLSIPLVSLAEVETREAAGAPSYLDGRVRRPVLFPGAAYPISRVTGLRGRVVRAGVPERWAMLEARKTTGVNPVVAHARCDDRGEFLLLVPPLAVTDSALGVTLTLSISVWSLTVPPAPNPVDIAAQDPYWDAPLETITEPVATDNVSEGTQRPTDYVKSTADSVITFVVDRLLTSRHVGDLTYVPPGP